MVLPLLYANANEQATLSNTFTLNNVATDPTTVSLIVTDNLGNITTYLYNPGTITRTGTGAYSQPVTVGTDGLWSYVWIGTGTVSEANPGTLRVFPATIGQWYVGMEEVKDRLQITDTLTDYQLQAAIQSAARFIERHCGRHFNQFTQTRTYVPYSIYEQPIDDLVSVTQLAVDMNGNGVYDTIWNTSQYQLSIGDQDFNGLAVGEPRPWTRIRVTQTGNFFPFIWPFSRIDRVQVQGVWGWPAVPADIMMATAMVAADLFKLKDTPFGLAGAGEYGIVRVKGLSPVVLEMLMPYRSPRRKVGM
jgi:hypothetical protein